MKNLNLNFIAEEIEKDYEIYAITKNDITVMVDDITYLIDKNGKVYVDMDKIEKELYLEDIAVIMSVIKELNSIIYELAGDTQ